MNARSALKTVGEQVALYERQMKVRPKQAAGMTSIELESRISITLHVHEMIRDVELSWSEHVRRGELPHDMRVAKSIQKLLGRWLAVAKSVWSIVQRVKHGPRSVTVERLRDAIGYCLEPRLDLDEVNKAFRQLERGKNLVRLTEGSHGIRHRRAG